MGRRVGIKFLGRLGALDHRVWFEMIVIPLGTHHAEAEAMSAHTILLFGSWDRLKGFRWPRLPSNNNMEARKDGRERLPYKGGAASSLATQPIE
ncbi:MAG: hypothetical protein EBT06_02765 [Gammaproteobacteria bacterium]|nr:hypothetical protein [Gammaproteobacteria bacterium]NBY23653.1 hypothetical protein [Gammaproteobacteria bacterium]